MSSIQNKRDTREIKQNIEKSGRIFYNRDICESFEGLGDSF